ncbi:hypothetical protein Agub_g13058 [Astrephomene gubernaculifera]|uniref:U-box domain-containing protein n=1 Tax=Astrephomene gubernaculifera TaxID=47775 RepID=A0AAD3HRT7_9CHLO|nr:hypothetical protein Agub_g13058 [Astrephomene gubernaculifera]
MSHSGGAGAGANNATLSSAQVFSGAATVSTSTASGRVAYQPTRDDTVSPQSSDLLISISAHLANQPFPQHESHEELQWEDYLRGMKHGSGRVAYQPTRDKWPHPSEFFASISALFEDQQPPKYKSHEELRSEDYLCGLKRGSGSEGVAYRGPIRDQKFPFPSDVMTSISAFWENQKPGQPESHEELRWEDCQRGLSATIRREDPRGPFSMPTPATVASPSPSDDASNSAAAAAGLASVDQPAPSFAAWFVREAAAGSHSPLSGSSVWGPGGTYGSNVGGGSAGRAGSAVTVSSNEEGPQHATVRGGGEAAGVVAAAAEAAAGLWQWGATMSSVEATIHTGSAANTGTAAGEGSVSRPFIEGMAPPPRIAFGARASASGDDRANGGADRGTAATVGGGGDRSFDDLEPDSLFLCPITLEVMEDPVIATDGYTYERSAITEWLAQHNTSPQTNEAMPDNAMLIPNHCLRSAIMEWKQKAGRL